MLKQVQHQLDKIEELVTSIKQNETEFMDIKDAAKFLRLKVSTLYQFIHNRKIPYHKATKKPLFKKSELIEWVEKDRVFTIEELEQSMNHTIN